MSKDGQGKRLRKLPVQQLTILAICRFAEPVVLTSVYPYIPEMIESFGTPKDQIAKWAGMASAVFSFSQSATAILWGHISDRFGRKPAVITGLLCTIICSLIWGFSSNLAMAIITRGIQGAFNGNVGTTRTMVAEMVPEKELQPIAFAILPMVWSLGSILGPSFGGFFANPAKHMPKLFGHSAFFIRFPFALPNILASSLFLVGITTAFLFLRETHHIARHKKDYGLILGAKLKSSIPSLFSKSSEVNQHSNQAAQNGFTETSPLLSSPTTTPSPHYPPKPFKKKSPSISQIFTRQSSLNLLNYTLLSMHSVTYDQLLPIFMHNPPAESLKSNVTLPFKFSGGFGFDSSRIGTIFTIDAILICACQFLIYPSVARRLGVLACFKACTTVFPIVYIITPYTALIRSSTIQQVTIMIILAFKSLAFIFSFPSSLILLTNSAKSLAVLGTLNGFAVSLSSIGRAIGPFVCGPALAWGIKNDYIIIPWWILGIISMLGAMPIWWIEEGDGFVDSDSQESSSIEGDDEGNR